MTVYTGDGVVFKVAASGGSPVAVAQVLSISGPDMSVGERDRTNLSSGGRRQYAAGLTDYGTVSLQLQFDSLDTQHRLLEASVDTRSTLDCQIVSTDGSTRSFSGFVTAFTTSGMDVEADILADVTIRLTTVITFDDGVI